VMIIGVLYISRIEIKHYTTNEEKQSSALFTRVISIIFNDDPIVYFGGVVINCEIIDQRPAETP